MMGLEVNLLLPRLDDRVRSHDKVWRANVTDFMGSGQF